MNKNLYKAGALVSKYQRMIGSDYNIIQWIISYIMMGNSVYGAYLRALEVIYTKMPEGLKQQFMDESNRLVDPESMHADFQDFVLGYVSGPDRGNRTHTIKLRLSISEKQNIVLKAEHLGYNVSEYARNVILGVIKVTPRKHTKLKGRGEYLLFKVTPDEDLSITLAAEAEGVTRSTYVRDYLLGDIKE